MRLLTLLPLIFCDGILWSDLGVVDDGRTDNTGALNALPVNTFIEGDCPHGGVILVQGLWNLRSNLYVQQHAGCELLSNSTGIGSYAISQLDMTRPLTNITHIGLTISKTTQVSGDRIMMAYIDNFQLLNWTFHHHGGAFFIRGSCQELAFGRSFDAALVVGSPGVRHIGNLPKAECLRPQPANVWVHHNQIVSGDGAYQCCQPLNNGKWVNVGSDDMLFEENTGVAVASAFILAGLSNEQGPHSNFSCTNVTFQNMQGSGIRLIYVQAASAPNVVESLTFRNLQLNVTPYKTYTPASIQVSALYGGTVRSVRMDGVRAAGTQECGLNETGLLEGIIFTNGEIAAPTIGSGPTVNIDDGISAVLSNSVIGALSGNNVNIGVTRSTQSAQVLNCTIVGVATGGVGIAIGIANGSLILGNRFSPAQGATNSTGIAMDAYNHYAGTTGAAMHGNDVRAMATGIVCGHGAGNNCTNNPGAKDC
jgi:hypothetical protein